MISKTALGVAAGLVGVVAYCLYFDRKRRSDPQFKQKLKQKREKLSKIREKSDNSSLDLPDMRDYESVQRFFIKEVQLGEELLASGDIESGIDHLSSAVAVCGQPQQLLQVLQQTLPPQAFNLLLQRLPIISQKLAKRVADTDVDVTSAPDIMTEDDVE